MIIYLSGETAAARPERVLGGEANVMLAYTLVRRRNNKITTRFLAMYKSRMKGKKKHG